MTTQTFNITGISETNGVSKVRWTNDMVRRVKILAKRGATRIDLVDLPERMNKIDALKFMLTHPKFQSEDDQATIQETLEDKVREFAKKGVRVKKAVSLGQIKSRPRNDVSVTDILEMVNG